MKRAWIGFVVAAALTSAAALQAQAAEKPSEKSSPDAAKKEPPKAEQSSTQHSIVIGGVPIAYTATAGTLIVRNEKDEPWASMGYTAYVKRDAGTRRPITFAYNGGPGSSSIWLHLGALGPRRIVTADAGPTPPPPYQLVDNAHSILDKTDVVMIDPVGTGYSKAVGDAKNRDFWGVDPDIESVSRFIKQYVSDNGRWNSPEVPARRELRLDALGRHRGLPPEPGGHVLQRRDSRLRRARHRGALHVAGQ